MLKKNIAKAMAAATVISAAAPMANVVFADVIDSNQEQEVKDLKAKVYEKFNTKYTKNEELLNVKGNADKFVYTTIQISINGATAQTCTSYADFETKFDNAFKNLENGEKITVSYTAPNGARELEDGTVVDFKEVEYTDVHSDVASNVTINGDSKQVIKNALADNTKYAKIPVSNDTETGDARYITVKNGEVKLDLAKPQYRVVNGYYVNSKGDSIKKFDEATVSKDMILLSTKDGVVDGYYAVTNQGLGQTISTDAIVRNVESFTKEDVLTSDLYEIAAGRLTKKGNELRKAIAEAKLKPAKDLLQVKIVGTDKAGEEVLEANLSSRLSDLTNIKILFEERENTISEWKPVYEINVKQVKGTDFTKVVDSVIVNAQVTDIHVAAGMDRYETAIELSKKGWDDKSLNKEGDAVVLVSGSSDKIVDGLTATPLAASLNNGKKAPVLLTKENEIPTEVIEEIERLGAKKVYIVGGAVSEAVETTLVKTYKMEVVRLAGEDRYETSLEVAKEMKTTTSTDLLNGKFKQVFVVGGKGEADALSASAIAAQRKSPILLTKAGEVDKDLKHFLDVNLDDTEKNGTNNDYTDIFVVGGNSSVSDDVLKTFASMEFESERLAGEGRQETNAAVIDRFATSVNNIVVAKSNNASLVDALGAGALAAKEGAHIVLATEALTEAQTDALDNVNTTSAKKVQAGYGIATKVATVIKKLR